MPSKTVTVTNSDGTTRTVTLPDRSKYAGARTVQTGYVYPMVWESKSQNNLDFEVIDDSTFNLTAADTTSTDWITFLSYHNPIRTGKHRLEFDLTLNSGAIDTGFTWNYSDIDEDPNDGNSSYSSSKRPVVGHNSWDFEIFNDGVSPNPHVFFQINAGSIFDISVTNFKITHEPRELTIDRTAPVIDSDRAGESRPLLSKVVGGATAAYSLRDLNDKAGNNKVARIRRDDNVEVDLLGNGKIVNVPLSEEGAVPDGYVPFIGDWTPILEQNGATVSFPSDYVWSYDNTGYTFYHYLTLDAFVGEFHATRQLNKTLKTGDTVAMNVTGVNYSFTNNWASVDFNVGLTKDHTNASTTLGDEATTPLSWNTNSNYGLITLTYNGTEDLVNPWLTISYPAYGSMYSALIGVTVISPAHDTYTRNIEEFLKEGGGLYEAYVERWYDQSGNGNHAIQTVAGDQPQIAELGELITRTINGKTVPVIKSTAGNHLTFTMDSLSADGQQSVFAVLENDVTSQDGYGAVFRATSTSSGTGGENRRPWWFGNPTGGLVFTVDASSGYTNSDRDYRLYSHIMNGTAGGTSTVRRDGTQVDTRSITLDENSNFSEGKLAGVTDNATGALYMSELIYYPSDQSANRPAIEANLANQYGITLS